MVDLKKLSRRLTYRSNEKQNSYLSNICGVGGGAIILNAWQIIFETGISFTNLLKVFSMGLIGIILILIGYSFLGGFNRNES